VHCCSNCHLASRAQLVLCSIQSIDPDTFAVARVLRSQHPINRQPTCPTSLLSWQASLAEIQSSLHQHPITHTRQTNTTRAQSMGPVYVNHVHPHARSCVEPDSQQPDSCKAIPPDLSQVYPPLLMQRQLDVKQPKTSGEVSQPTSSMHLAA
jgi:hypothetical protein